MPVKPATEEWGEVYGSWGTDRRYPGYGMKVQAMAVPTLKEWPGGRMLTEREGTVAADLRAPATVYALPNGAEIRPPEGAR